MPKQQYTIRVYALLINDENEILLMDETNQGSSFTKFPGGGMEAGESTLDCISREIKEELNLDITDWEHFYTTDFFVSSQFHTNTQVIAVYFKATHPINFNSLRLNMEDTKLKKMHFVPLNDLALSMLTFKTDKKVAELLKLR